MSDKNLDTPQPEPEPSWDYYFLWHSLITAKAKIEKLMQQISTLENASDEQDEKIEADFKLLVNFLEAVNTTNRY